MFNLKIMEYFSVWDSTEVLKRLEWDKCETFHRFMKEELFHQKVTCGGAWEDSENLSCNPTIAGRIGRQVYLGVSNPHT